MTMNASKAEQAATVAAVVETMDAEVTKAGGLPRTRAKRAPRPVKAPAAAPVKRAGWALQVTTRNGKPRPILIVTDVPPGTKEFLIEKGLTEWAEWDKLRAQLPDFAALRVVPWPDVDTTPDGMYVIAWDQLRPAVRRLTVPVEGPFYRALVRAATAAGQPLTTYVRDVLTAAVDQNSAS